MYILCMSIFAESILCACHCYLKKIIHKTLFVTISFYVLFLDHVTYQNLPQAGSRMSDVGIHFTSDQNFDYKALLTYAIYLPFFSVIGPSGRGWKWMVIEYGKLDTRSWRTKDPCVMLISYMELVIMGPLCILWYSAVVLLIIIIKKTCRKKVFEMFKILLKGCLLLRDLI